MARLIGNNSSRRNLLNSDVRVAGAKPRIKFKAPLVGLNQNIQPPTVFDVHGNYNYPIRDLGAISDDARLLGALEILASSPVATATDGTQAAPPVPPTAEKNPVCDEAPDGIQFAAEDSVIWHDNTGRHHIIYGKYITENLPGATYTFRTSSSEEGLNAAKREITVVVDPVFASPQKPVRVLYYNRYDATSQGRRFDPATAIPFFYVSDTSLSDPSNATLIGKVFTNAFFPEIDHDDRPDTLDLIFWTNKICQSEPDQTKTEEPGPTGPITGDKATSGSGSGGTAQKIIQTGAGGSGMSSAGGGSHTTLVGPPTSLTQVAPATPCAPGDPFVGTYPNGKVSVGRTCKRQLMHCEGLHLFVVNQSNALNSLFLMSKPYQVAEFDDGPVSPLVSSDKLVASDKPEGSAENNSTTVVNDKGCPGDLDDLLRVKDVSSSSIAELWKKANNDFQQAQAAGDQAAMAAARQTISDILNGKVKLRSAMQLMLRMNCSPDPRGVPITNGKNIGMLRDISLLKNDWLTLKTKTFFTFTDTPLACEGGVSGPIRFVMVTAPPCVKDKDPEMQGGAMQTINPTQIGGFPTYSAATISP
jgi:hypothetical protein